VSSQEQGESAWSSRVEALSPAKRALLDELKRRKAAVAAHAGQLADIAWLRAGGTGSGDPVVLAHPIGGSLFCYLELCQALPAERVVVGVAAGRAMAEPADLTVEGLARHDVARLAEADVPRPAVVAGWSFGGLLAYEMARHWHRANGLLTPVVLIDSAPWCGDDPPWDQGMTLRAFTDYLLGLAGVTEYQGFDPVPWRLPVGEALAGVAGQLREQGVDLGFSADELIRRYQMFANAADAMCRYQPAGYAGPVVLVRTDEAAQEADPWLSADAVTTVRVSGDHYGVLRPPVVAEVAQVITEAADW
jgi:thioesterase domain-containing protein